MDKLMAHFTEDELLALKQIAQAYLTEQQEKIRMAEICAAERAAGRPASFAEAMAAHQKKKKKH